MFFNPGHPDHLGRIHPFAAKTGATKDMGGQTAVGIEPHFARAKFKPGIADVMHLLHLLRADAFFDPDKFAFAGEQADQLIRFQIREDFDQFSRDTFGINHRRRLGIKCVGLQVGGQDAAVAVHNIGTLRHDRVARAAGVGFGRLRAGQHTHTHTDDGEGGNEKHPQHQQAALRPQARPVMHFFVTQADVFALDGVRVLAFLARFQDPGQRAKGRAQTHWVIIARAPTRDTGLVIMPSGSAG